MRRVVNETCSQLCHVLREEINESERNTGIDMGARIGNADPIGYDCNGCSLLLARPSPFFNSSLPTAGHKQYTIVQPVERALRVGDGRGL